MLAVEIYLESDTFNLRCIISEVDGNKYCVRERSKITLAADLLAKVTENMKELVKYVEKTNCDGCVVTYSGFHPHMLGNTNYAYLRVENNKIIDIQEKKPFTSSPMNECASSGTYYFKTAYTCSFPAGDLEYFFQILFFERGC